MGTPDIELLRIDEGRFDAFRTAFNDVFGESAPEASASIARGTAEYERFLGAYRSGQVVGTAGAFSFDLSLPWAEPAGCAGVTVVSVRADHRRRGLLTRMMHQLLDDADDRHEPFAALWASEGPIYGRYGFGPAIPTGSIRIDADHARFRVEADPGAVQLVDADEAARRFPAIHDAVRRQRHGMMSRSEPWWTRELADLSEQREGAGPKRYALIHGRGYAVHRLRPVWDDGVPRGIVEVQELVATDADAYRALWRFVIDTDLAATVTAGSIPVDDPISVLLDDPVRSRLAQSWPVYLRLVDVPEALMARGYRVDDTLTMRVHDRSRPRNDRAWRLAVRDGVARCEPFEGGVDLELDVTTLATLSLGGVRVTSLAAAGAIVASTADAVPRLERLLATDVAPWHGSMF